MLGPGSIERKKSAGRDPLARNPPHNPRRQPSLLVLATALQIAVLVESTFLAPLSLASHLLALLDQLADLLATLVADLRVELCASRCTDGLAALLADLLVELVPALG